MGKSDVNLNTDELGDHLTPDVPVFLDFLPGPSEDEVLHGIEQDAECCALSLALFTALAYPDLWYGADPNRRTTAKADRFCNKFK